MTKVTVLMAVYNAADYLPQTLDSLLAQTLKDIQVVCIDDASTDGSPQILADYARRDSRIEVITLTENQGQAQARNEGLKRAKGDCVCMLDADDWFEPDALERAVDAMADDTDAVLFDVSLDYADHAEMYPMPDFQTLAGYDAFVLSLTWKIHGLYLVRADLHRRFPYDTTCRLYSDDNTTRLHYLYARRVGRCTGVYHYRQHASATHQVSVRRFDYLRANESMKRILQEQHVGRQVESLYETHRWHNLVGVYMFYFVHGRELPEADRRYGLAELHRAWLGIDRSLLDRRAAAKFGYRPMPSWTLFRLQEWLYFTLRGIMGKNY